MKRLIRQLASVAVMTLVAATSTAQPQDTALQEITVRGTVEAIDHTARTVRIRGTQGNVVTLDVPASATRVAIARIRGSRRRSISCSGGALLIPLG